MLIQFWQSIETSEVGKQIMTLKLGNYVAM